MEQNKVRTYILYAVGEILLVMIGILLALQVNNWNEKRNSELKTQEYYSQLLDDLKSDREFITLTIGDLSRKLSDYEMYISLYSSEAALTPDQVYKQISQLTLISNALTFNTSTIESLQNSGDIRLIPSTIRNRLIDLKRLQNLTITRFEDIDDGANRVTQKLSTLIGATTLPARLERQTTMKEFLSIDENLKELILVYEGIHRWKEVSFRETIGRLEEMTEDIDGIVELINMELDK
ncbi:DUF6090 family protein [Rhodohalobacter mucosus]|uniref:Uncharacterized protein n=1 Tax=Rhodohalobacter mucosus TaxID=2079485 RepID=A0A316TQI5_9BACT|nr:DUF6090 family protein [Rhodohalobacter mucosus]PWN05499.1 hypothetical protein DDZ15_12895 [Rhodohalobacter mucosus]